MTRVPSDVLRRPALRPPRHPGFVSTTAVTALCLVGLLGSVGASAPPQTARALYERAAAKDHAVRTAMAEARGPQGLSPAPFRDAIAAYRQVVWRYPTSGYCDNALWQGALLAIEAYDRFAQEQDRQTALTLLRMLAREYPASRFVARSRAAATRMEALPAARPAPAPPATAAPEPAAPRLVTIEYVQRSALPDSTEIVVYLDGPVTFHQDRVGQPDRVFYDLPGTRPSEPLKDAELSFDTGLVRQIRIGRHANAVTRLVLDAAGVGQVQAQLYGSPHRLVVTCSRAGITPQVETPTATALPPTAAGADGPVVAVVPRPQDATAGAAPTARVTAPEGAPAVSHPASAAPPASPSSNVRGGYSLARQLGLGASRIVIDPGHGGHDPGTTHGTLTEAALTLDIALRLEALLQRRPGLEVVLTRRTDVFLPLDERTAIANREEADLFVSIHVNASRNRAARGVETYLLDFASTPDAEAVAARENASSVMTMTSLNDLVKKIALTSKADESRDLAVLLQNSMVRRLRPHNTALRDLGVKRAPFIVLIGAAMPSVLVEVAFLTHAQEGRLLSRQSYRQRVAESLSEGIRRYLDSLKKAPPVVLQRPPDTATPSVRDWEPLQ